MVTNIVRASTGNPENLTWDEICRRLPNQWVVLVDIDWVNETDFEFATAAVIAHHKHRKEASPHIKATRAPGVEVGCFWTGEIRGPIPRCVLP